MPENLVTGILALVVCALLVYALLRARLHVRRLEALQRIGPLTLAGGDTANQLARDIHEGWAAVFQQIIYSANDIFWETDAEHRYKRVLYRTPAPDRADFDEHIGHLPWELPSVGVTQAAWDAHRESMEKREPLHEFVVGRIDRNGALRYDCINGVPVYSPGGEFVGYRGACRDYTAIRQTQLQLEIRDAVTRILAGATRLSDALPAILEAICQPLGWRYGARWMRDARNNTLVCGETWTAPEAQPMAEASRARRFPISQHGVISRALTTQAVASIADVAQEPGFLRREAAQASGLQAAFAFPVVVQGDVVCVLEFLGPHRQQADDLITSLAQSIGNQIALFWLRREAEARLTYAATHDALTGLRNRLAFNAELERAIARARRNHWRLGLMFIDLDGFKLVNDRLGHHAGDTLLIEIAKRLKNNLRSSDTLARMGGDEFVVLLEQTGTDGEIAEVAYKLLGMITEPYEAFGGDAPVSASIGIAIYPVDAEDQQNLLAHADAAMYRSKASSGSRVVFYRPPADEVPSHHRGQDVSAAINAAEQATPATLPPGEPD